MLLQDDIAVVPLYRDVILWAMRDNLDLPISPGASFTFERRA